MANENDEEQEPFSDDPDEQLRMENELLKLKMQAQFGAFFGGDANLPPDMEQEFLKQVMAFQENHANTPLVKLHDVIGNPEYRLSAEIPEAALPQQWEQLEQALADKGLLVTFGADYPLAVKYDFVINELFPLEIQQPQEGHNWVFPYEEFHPNHKLELEQGVARFMEDFFGNQMPEEAPYLADPLVTDAGVPLSGKDFVAKVERFHGLFRELKDYKYNIDETHIDEAPEGGAGMGFVEGAVEYNVITEDGSPQIIRGPFKCYFQDGGGYWDMFFFWLHGFSWA